jgi:tetratricopeptide (TPR) repeat protein
MTDEMAMKFVSRKFWVGVAPLAVGVLLLAGLWRINSYRSGSSAKSDTSTATAETVPQNAAHERASLEEQLKRNPDHAPILMRLAEIERDAGNQAGAIANLRKVLKKDPKNADARLELGRSLYDSGDIDGALKETRQLVADHPDNVDGLYNLGAIYANQNQFDLARQFWNKAVSVAPQSDSGRRAQDGLTKLGQ